MGTGKGKGEILYQSAHITARFIDSFSDRITICFPDMDHPVGPDAPNWGSAFFGKRRMSAVYLAINEINWFQTPDFFDAMAAIRDRFKGERALNTYGSSMGGYGAFLGAKELNAKLCLGLSPQFSIDPKIVEFERRYDAQAQQIGAFTYDLKAQVSDDCQYVAAFDPTHRLDRLHVARLSDVFNLEKLPVYGVGHGVLPWLTQGDARNVLGQFLRGQSNFSDLRVAVRREREASPAYLRRMGNKAHEKGHTKLYDFATAARKIGREKLAKKLTPALVSAHRPKVVIHCGLPKTGTTSLQAYFHAQSKFYRKRGVFYPVKHADPKDRNHAWMSRDLRDGSVDLLRRTIKGVPLECDTVFFSDESLFVELPGLQAAARSAVKEVLSDLDVELVFFERDKTEWMQSFYIQSVQNRRSGPKTLTPSARNLWQTELSYDAFFALPYCQELLNFETMKESLAELFKASRVRSLTFDKRRDVVPAFCNEMGWTYKNDIPALLRNPSLRPAEAEILRQANALDTAQSRMIKALLEIPSSVSPDKMRKRRVERLTKQARRFPWESISYQPNTPLRFSAQEFDACLQELRRKADIFLDFESQTQQPASA